MTSTTFRKSTLREYFESIVIAVILALFIRTWIVQAFKIPTGSMEKSLLIGDHLLVNKFVFGPTSTLFEQVVTPTKAVQRGDILVFKYPQEPERDFIKRVIGLPGDIIEVRGGQVILNGTAVKQKAMKPLRLPVDGNAPCSPDQFPGARVHGADGRDYCELPVRQEILPNGKTYLTIDMGPSALDWYGPVRVPADHVFLMGDNRDNSADSRAPLAENGLGGPVPWEAIGGRAEFITFSLDGDASWNPLSWIHAFRSGRAGNSLRARSVAAPD